MIAKSKKNAQKRPQTMLAGCMTRTHKERDANAINAENDAINRITNQPIIIIETKK